MTTLEIREECRKYALKWVDIQRDDFKRLGVLGRWEDPYLTHDARLRSRHRAAPSSSFSTAATSTRD